jgi:hypothetical protein
LNVKLYFLYRLVKLNNTTQPENMQIKNNTTNEIDIYSSMFTVTRFLPGINILLTSEYEKVSQHPSFKVYLDIKDLEVIKDVDLDEVNIDEDTKLSFIPTKDGDIQPITESVGKKVKPVNNQGRVFSISLLKSQEIPKDIAKKILDNQTSNGYLNSQQVLELLGESAETEIGLKIADLFE